MGKAVKIKHERRQLGDAYREMMREVRVQWLGKRVAFDAGRGDGVQQGRVTEVLDNGLLYVECLPEYRGRAVGLVLTLGMLSQLTLVETEE
jgi:hypothetical protein